MPQSTVNSPKINCLQLKMPQEEYVRLQPIDEKDAKSTIDKKMPKSTDDQDATVYRCKKSLDRQQSTANR